MIFKIPYFYEAKEEKNKSLCIAYSLESENLVKQQLTQPPEQEGKITVRNLHPKELFTYSTTQSFESFPH